MEKSKDLWVSALVVGFGVWYSPEMLLKAFEAGRPP